MANMSYCRFENTYEDLRDCFDNINDDLDGSEFRYRNRIIELAKQIAEYDTEDFVEPSEDDE